MFLALLTAAAALSPLSSFTVHDDSRRSVTVSAADLDLTQEDHVATLAKRVDAAARLVCRDPGPIDSGMMKLRRECMRGAVDGSRPHVERMIAAATSARGTTLAAR